MLHLGCTQTWLRTPCVFIHLLLFIYKSPHPVPPRPAQGNLFAVGDPAQAIYGWRGSNPHFMRKHLHTVHPVLNQHALTVNYRSLPKVVDVAERLWDRFPSQFPHYGKLSANRVHGAGTVVEVRG